MLKEKMELSKMFRQNHKRQKKSRRQKKEKRTRTTNRKM